MPKPLSARQERFVHEYLLDHNASAAARRAGYSGKTRGSQACALMKNPLVCERIALATADRYAELKINGFDILKARAREAFFDPGVLLDTDSKPVPLHQLSAETRTVLSLSYDMKGNVRVRQAPRNAALAVLEKRYLEMLRLQVEVFGRDAAPAEDEVPQRVARIPASRVAPQAFRLAPGWNEPPPQETPAAADDAAPVDPVALAAAQIEQAEVAAKAALRPGLVEPMHAVAEKAKAAPATPAQPAEAPSHDPDAPPSPYEPGYNFKKDPNAAYGGRFKAWNLYQEKKRQQEQQACEAAAAGLAPNQRIGPGRTVRPRMEPGYNPPWLRDNRPRFAVGAGEFYFSGEEDYE
ncbi:MAG TPA: terminase small subunit [Burkholderiales bacterium]|nr:terminase small subunit [Burkholderiales bacterium]